MDGTYNAEYPILLSPLSKLMPDENISHLTLAVGDALRATFLEVEVVEVDEAFRGVELCG